MSLLIDNDVDPCDDFYHHACGGWIKPRNMPHTDQTYSFETIEAHKERIIEMIIHENPPLVGPFWDSCINADRLTHGTRELLQQEMKSITQAKTMHDLWALAGEFTRKGVDTLVQFDVAVDTIDPRINTVYLKPPQLLLPHLTAYKRPSFHTLQPHMRQYVSQLIHISGFSFFKTHDVDPVTTILKIDQQLAGISKSRRINQRVPITSFLSSVLPHTLGSYFYGLELLEHTPLDTRIHIEDYSYFEYMENTLFQSITIQEMKQYLAFRIFHGRMKWLSKDFYHLYHTFYHRHVQGKENEWIQRDDVCIHSLVEYLPDVIGHFYTIKVWDLKRQEYGVDMIKRIKESMNQYVEQSKWLDPQDKEKTINRITQVYPLVGHSTRSLSYPLDLVHDDYSANVHTILVYLFQNKIKKIGQRSDLNEWTQSSASMNAFYNRRRNTILFPAALLQPPLFNGSSFHPAQNFGSIGTMMGYQLSLVFNQDRDGNTYDSTPWWKSTSVKTYDTRAQRLKRQYSSFPIHGQDGTIRYVDGAFTFDSNLADQTGVTVAWNAYRQYITTKTKKEKNIGDRMFFLAFAQTWCANIGDQAMGIRLDSDSHTPPQWRVNGVVKNNKDFGEVFECKVNAPMNPINKFEMW